MSRKTRKLIWSAPLVAVLAVAGALAIFMTLVPNGASAHDLTGAVTGLSAEAKSRTSIEVSWTAPAGGNVTGYRIDISDLDLDEPDRLTHVWESHVADTGNTNTTYLDTRGLSAGAVRYYRVFALNDAGAGPVSTDPNFAWAETPGAGVPDQAGRLSARGVSASQITLSWSAPADDGGSDIGYYCINASRNTTLTGATAAFEATGCPEGATLVASTPEELDTLRGVNSGNGTIIVDADDGTTFEHKSLGPEETWRYRLYAYSESQSNDATNIATAKTLKAAVPGAPRNLRAVRTGANEVTLYWNWPQGDKTTPITDFVVETKVGSTPAGIEDATGGTADAAQSTVTVSGLTGTVRYRVRVLATGTWSNSDTIDLEDDTVLERPATPGMPENDADEETVELPADDPVAASAGQRVKLTQIDLVWPKSANQNATPQKPTGYVIDARLLDDQGAADTMWMPLQSNTGNARTTYNHKNLEPNQQWQYRIFPEHRGAYGEPVSVRGWTKAAVPPDQIACADVSATADGPTKVKLDWTRPSSDGGAAISGYQVRWATNDVEDNDDTLIDSPTFANAPKGKVGASTFTYTFNPSSADALGSEAVRWFQVIVLNSVNTDAEGDLVTDGDDADSDDDEFMVGVCEVRGRTAKSGRPGMPDALTVEAAKDANSDFGGDLGVLLLWNAPDDPAGDVVTGYVIARKVNNGAWVEEWATISREAPDYMRTYYTDTIEPDFANGEVRRYRVSAMSGEGTGAWTPVVTYPHSAATHPTALTAPDDVMASTDAANTLNLEWTPAPNADRYLLIAVDMSGARDTVTGLRLYETALVDGGESSMGEVTDLVSGRNYLGIVVALKGSGATREIKYDFDPVSVTVQ